VTVSVPAVAGTNTVTIPASTGTVMVSGNMPAFSAYNGSAQTFSNATFTKATFPTEEFDTNSNFASSTFTPTVAGYYQLSAGIGITATAPTNGILALYKNGSAYKRFTSINLSASLNNITPTGSITVYANGTTDYFEIYMYMAGTSPSTFGGQDLAWFTGSMIRTA